MESVLACRIGANGTSLRISSWDLSKQRRLDHARSLCDLMRRGDQLISPTPLLHTSAPHVRTFAVTNDRAPGVYPRPQTHFMKIDVFVRIAL